jgi:drug/metabolite transporter (DMT)-like permease
VSEANALGIRVRSLCTGCTVCRFCMEQKPVTPQEWHKDVPFTDLRMESREKTIFRGALKALLWMCGALLSFSLLAIGARELSGAVSIYQTLLIRSAVGLVLILSVMKFKNQGHLIATQRLSFHVFRNVIHFAGQYGWFVGIGLLPLAEVFALEFTVPFWTIIIAALFLGETVTARKVVSIVLGMLGVLLIVKPGYEIINVASFVVLAAAICFAIVHTSTKALSGSEKPLTIIFYMCVVQLPIGFVLSIADWVWPQPLQWIWLLVVGLTALSAHFCLAKAMQYAEITRIVTLDFLRLPLIALVGVLLYNEAFEISLMAGGLLMLLGNFISLYKRRTVTV